jgi:hypothetical protein
VKRIAFLLLLCFFIASALLPAQDSMEQEEAMLCRAFRNSYGGNASAMDVSLSSQKPSIYMQNQVFQKDLWRNEITNTASDYLLYKWNDQEHLILGWKVSGFRQDTFHGIPCYCFELTYGTYSSKEFLVWVEIERNVVLAQDEYNEYGILTSRRQNLKFILLDSGSYLVSTYREWKASSPYATAVYWITDWEQDENVDDYFFTQEYLFSLI